MVADARAPDVEFPSSFFPGELKATTGARPARSARNEPDTGTGSGCPGLIFRVPANVGRRLSDAE